MEEGFGEWYPPSAELMAEALKEERLVRKNRQVGAWFFFGGILLLFFGAVVSSLLEHALHFKFQTWQNACFVLPVAIAATFGLFGLLSRNSIMEVPSWVPLEDV